MTGVPAAGDVDALGVDPVVDLRGLVRDFGDVRAVGGLDLALARGEVVGLLGHNGAGKTTTLRHLTGVLAPTAGSVRVFGKDPLVDGTAVRQRIGVLPAGSGVDGGLTGRENLRVVADLWGMGRAEAARRTEGLLDELDLAEAADARAETYSTGMRQRLALARVLLHAPDLLLLDEPTAALDPVAARQVREVVAALARDEGRTTLLCTHNLEEAQELCGRVVVLERGRVLAEGTPRELIADVAGGGLDLDVPAAERERARRILAGLGHTVTGTGPRLTVAGIRRAQVPAVLAALVEGGIPVHAAVPVVGSLEDAYLRLHEASS